MVDSSVDTHGNDGEHNSVRQTWAYADKRKDKDSRVMIVFGKHCNGNDHVLTKYSKASRGCTCFAFPLGMIDLEEPAVFTKLQKLGSLSFICVYIDLSGCEEAYVRRVSEACCSGNQHME